MEDKAVAKTHIAYVTVKVAFLCIKYLDEHGTPPSLFIHHDSGKKKKVSKISQKKAANGCS